MMTKDLQGRGAPAYCGGSANLLFEALHRCACDSRLDLMTTLIRLRHAWQVQAMDDCLEQWRPLRAGYIGDLEKARELVAALKLHLPVSPDAPPASEEELLDQAIRLVEQFQAIVDALSDSLQKDIDRALELRFRNLIAGTWAETSDGVSEEWPPLIGLAVSGGGIRSASFSLGAFQALAKAGLLPVFDVVSSVSGGGYAASLLCAWSYRHENGIRGVSSELFTGVDGGPVVRWVRRYCSYLAPSLRFGITGEAWGWAVAYLSSLAVVVLQISLLVLALLLLPRSLVAAHHWLTTMVALPSGRQFGFPAVVLTTIALILFISAFRRLSGYAAPSGQLWLPPTSISNFVAFGAISVFLSVCVVSPLTIVELEDGWRRFVEPNGFRAAVPTIRSFLFVLAVTSGVWISSAVIARMLGSATGAKIIRALRVLLLGGPAGAAPGIAAKSVQPILVGCASTIASAAACALLVAGVAWYGSATLGSSGYVVAFGPLILSALFLVSEMAGQQLIRGYQRDAERAWRARLIGWMLAPCLAWYVLCFVSLQGGAFLATPDRDWAPLVPVAAGLVLLLILTWRFLGANIALYLIVVAAYLGILGEVFFSLVATLPGDDPVQSFKLFFVTLGAGWLVARTSAPNRLSLHGLYKECLVRAFLGASRLRPGNINLKPSPAQTDSETASQFRPRNPNPAINVDVDDDLALAWARSTRRKRLPLFIFNAALHRTTTTEPFTFSPLYCGSPAIGVGYAPTTAYGRADSALGLTLGTAMAVSGAAMSPVRPGYSNPLRAFVHGLLNLRLGMWIGIARYPAAIARESSSFGGGTILAETLSIVSAFTRHVHLSDGGHFENLGIYELVRRGCRQIVAIDATCDPDVIYGDLVIAMKKVKQDFGVMITPEDGFENFEVHAGGTPSNASARGWHWLTIDYGRGQTPGRLLYIKSSLIEAQNMPFEVRHYARKSEAFPHESTTDQFFTEEQFDAYRLLGEAISEDALLSSSDKDGDSLMRRAILRATLAEMARS